MPRTKKKTKTVEQLTEELNQVRAEMAAAIGALQDLSISPEDAGIQFYVKDGDKDSFRIEPKRVEGIFAALEKHAAVLLPWGKAAVESHYKIDRVRAYNNQLRTKYSALFKAAAKLVDANKAWADYCCDCCATSDVGTSKGRNISAELEIAWTNLRTLIGRGQD